MILKCLAVDDEPLALDILEDYISRVEILHLESRCLSAMEGINILRKRHIDILFLDIQMPDLSGFDLLEAIIKKPKIIFTSAYEQYGTISYDYDAVDYLLKPYSFTRFLKAVDKVVQTHMIDYPVNAPNSHKNNLDFIFLRHGNNTIKVALDKIDYIEGMNDYVLIRTADKNFIVRDNLKKVEDMLSGSEFVRIHKSFIIPLSKIDYIHGNSILVRNKEIPIGRFYKETFLNLVDARKIG